jgi:ribosomal protein L16/L10AE
VSVASRLNVSSSAPKMRDARDGRREKILDVEDKSRAMFLHPQKTTSLMRALTLANDSMARANVTESARRIDKKHRDKSGEMLWIVFCPR